MVTSTHPGRLLDVEARRHLAEAVRAAERRTRGEIVLMVVRACDEYGSAGWRLGVALAVAAFCGLHAFAAPQPWWVYLLAQLAGLLLGHALARFDPLRRLLLGPRLAEERVHERARSAFLENGLARTHGRTGILLFVALLERRVVVLADAGIHGVLDPGESWEEVVELALEGLRSGRAVQGLEAAIGRCGEILVHHFPVSPERNTDELPNAVVIED
jgi:putative membrane protein